MAPEEKLFNPATSVNVASNTITLDATDYVTGQMVCYDQVDGSNSLIGGLENGYTYYVIKVNNATIKLADSAADAALGNAIDLTSTGTGIYQKFTKEFDPVNDVNLANDTIKIDAHGFQTGQTVEYINAGGGYDNVGGLQNGQVYYVIKVDDNTIQLALTRTDALKSTPIPIDLTSLGSAPTTGDVGNKLISPFSDLQFDPLSSVNMPMIRSLIRIMDYSTVRRSAI